jgi:hypothetical protein
MWLTTQYTKADPYLKQLLNAPQGQIPTNILMEIHLMRFKVDSAGASYPSAIKHYQLYKHSMIRFLMRPKQTDCPVEYWLRNREKRTGYKA